MKTDASRLKTYDAPCVVDYGTVANLTGIFGSAAVTDTSFGPAGREIAHGTGSIDQCATRSRRLCDG